MTSQSIWCNVFVFQRAKNSLRVDHHKVPTLYQSSLAIVELGQPPLIILFAQQSQQLAFGERDFDNTLSSPATQSLDRQAHLTCLPSSLPFDWAESNTESVRG